MRDFFIELYRTVPLIKQKGRNFSVIDAAKQLSNHDLNPMGQNRARSRGAMYRDFPFCLGPVYAWLAMDRSQFF